jgi:CYTH domain-containing protein
MAQEIERKYLVRNDAWRDDIASSSRFLQAYIAVADDRSVRVRIMDDEKAKLTIKIGTELFSRSEFEYEIPLADAKDMAAGATGIVLDKTRYTVEHQGYVWEVDVYSGIYDGLVVAEVELQSETERPPIPDWIGEDVTGDRRYSNAVMANQDLSRELLDGLPPATR